MKRYCESCKQIVKGSKRNFSWLTFLICFGVFYLPYHWFLKRKVFCPMCGLKTKRKGTAEKITENEKNI